MDVEPIQRHKREVTAKYDAVVDELDTEQWLKAGNSVRIPESRAAHYFVERKVDTAVDLSRLPPGSDVIEVGASLGQMSFLLAERFTRLVAVDLSKKSLYLAKKRADYYGVTNISFHQSDAEDLTSFADHTFDGAFSFSALRYAPNPLRAIQEIHRVVKPGGTAVIDFPNKYCPWFGPIKKIVGVPKHVHDRLFSAAEVVRMMGEVGFSGIGHRHLLFTTRRLPDRLLPIFRVLDVILERLPLINRMAAIIMIKGIK